MRVCATWEHLRVKADRVLFAANTVWSIFERVRGIREDVLYKSKLPLPSTIVNITFATLCGHSFSPNNAPDATFFTKIHKSGNLHPMIGGGQPPHTITIFLEHTPLPLILTSKNLSVCEFLWQNNTNVLLFLTRTPHITCTITPDVKHACHYVVNITNSKTNRKYLQLMNATFSLK